MRVARFVLSFLLILASSPRLNSQQSTTTPQRDQQAVAIISASLSSMGVSGYSQGAPQTTSGVAVQDSLAMGTVSLWDGMSGSITLKTKGIGLVRSDFSINGNQTAVVANNGSGYVTQGGGKSNLPLWVTKYRRAGHSPVFSRMADYAQPNTNITYVGLETIAGASVHHIRISSLPTDGTPVAAEYLISEFHMFIDAASMLPVKTLSFDLSAGAMQNRVPIETYFSDYRSIQGILVPFRVTRYLRGQKQMDIVLTSVQLNVGLSSADFQ